MLFLIYNLNICRLQSRCCHLNTGSLRLLNHACFEHFPLFQQLAVIKIYVPRPSINERALRLELV